MRSSFLFLFAVLLSYGSSARASIWDIVNYPADQNGWNLSGTITTNDVGTVANVVSVDATLSNGATSYLLTGFVTNDGSGVEPTIVGNSLVITNNYEVFHLGNYRLGSASDPAEVTYESADGGLYEAITNFTDITLWQDGYGVNPGPSVPGDSIGDDPMILATLQSSSQTVPESSAAVVWSLLGALALGVGKWRKRGTTPDRSTNCQ